VDELPRARDTALKLRYVCHDHTVLESPADDADLHAIRNVVAIAIEHSAQLVVE
jgi:hypothetical protein